MTAPPVRTTSANFVGQAPRIVGLTYEVRTSSANFVGQSAQQRGPTYEVRIGVGVRTGVGVGVRS